MLKVIMINFGNPPQRRHVRSRTSDERIKTKQLVTQPNELDSIRHYPGSIPDRKRHRLETHSSRFLSVVHIKISNRKGQKNHSKYMNATMNRSAVITYGANFRIFLNIFSDIVIGGTRLRVSSLLTNSKGSSAPKCLTATSNPLRILSSCVPNPVHEPQ